MPRGFTSIRADGPNCAQPINAWHRAIIHFTRNAIANRLYGSASLVDVDWIKEVRSITSRRIGTTSQQPLPTYFTLGAAARRVISHFFLKFSELNGIESAVHLARRGGTKKAEDGVLVSPLELVAAGDPVLVYGD